MFPILSSAGDVQLGIRDNSELNIIEHHMLYIYLIKSVYIYCIICNRYVTYILNIFHV